MERVAEALKLLDSRGVDLMLEWVKGHGTSYGNYKADMLASAGSIIKAGQINPNATEVLRRHVPFKARQYRDYSRQVRMRRRVRELQQNGLAKEKEVWDGRVENGGVQKRKKKRSRAKKNGSKSHPDQPTDNDGLDNWERTISAGGAKEGNPRFVIDRTPDPRNGASSSSAPKTTKGFVVDRTADPRKGASSSSAPKDKHGRVARGDASRTQNACAGAGADANASGAVASASAAAEGVGPFANDASSPDVVDLCSTDEESDDEVVFVQERHVSHSHDHETRTGYGDGYGGHVSGGPAWDLRVPHAPPQNAGYGYPGYATAVPIRGGTGEAVSAYPEVAPDSGTRPGATGGPRVDSGRQPAHGSARETGSAGGERGQANSAHIVDARVQTTDVPQSPRTVPAAAAAERPPSPVSPDVSQYRYQAGVPAASAAVPGRTEGGPDSPIWGSRSGV